MGGRTLIFLGAACFSGGVERKKGKASPPPEEE